MKKIILLGLIIGCAFALIGCADDTTTTTTVDSQVDAPKGSEDLIGEIAAQIKALFED